MIGLDLVLVCLSLPDPYWELRRFPPHQWAAREEFLTDESKKTWGEVVCWATPSVVWIDWGSYSPLSRSSPQRALEIEIYNYQAHRLQCLMALRAATNPECGDRKGALDRLKCLLTAEEWAAGQIPPPLMVFR